MRVPLAYGRRLGVVVALLLTISAGGGTSGQPVMFDANDVSYLWPVPTSAADVAGLLSADVLAEGSSSTIWPKGAFDLLLKTALDTSVPTAGSPSRIRFGQFAEDYADPKTWKVAAFRVDPSAPGGHSGTVKIFGSTPQLRVILQPVTIENGVVHVHDVTAHLAFSFIKPSQAPPPGFPRVPDTDHFRRLLDDLRALKSLSEGAGVSTAGPLRTHPALVAAVPGFANGLHAFLRRHMLEPKLTEMAFMGLDQPEPWIFFGMVRDGGSFVRTRPPAIGKHEAQMLILRGGTPVLLAPGSTNVSGKIGVSTASIFETVELVAGGGARFDGDWDASAVAGAAGPLLRDIPDIIANPERAHVLNTDCVSCHTESSLRAAFNVTNSGAFRYKVPAGISGVEAGHLPNHVWNVRNLGWFPDFFQDGKAVPSISMRTANETAEAVEFVNRVYWGAHANGDSGNPPSGVSRPAGRQSGGEKTMNSMEMPAQSPLTLIMNIKSKEDYSALKRKIEHIQALPPDQNPIMRALNEIGTVHFARFVFLGEQQLAVITTYDGSFDRYIDAFVNVIGQVFDDILQHVADAPPLPVSQHRREFLDYIKKHDVPSVPPFYSAYPRLRVLDILQMEQEKRR